MAPYPSTTTEAAGHRGQNGTVHVRLRSRPKARAARFRPARATATVLRQKSIATPTMAASADANGISVSGPTYTVLDSHLICLLFFHCLLRDE